MFVGDVQGCRAELEELLRRCDHDPARDALVCVGDLVNRGPDSLGTLRRLRELGARSVLGNHDLHLLRVAAGLRELRAEDTFVDVLAAPDRGELLAWLGEHPFALRAGGALVVHAGLHPAWGDPVERLRGLDPLVPHPDSDFATRVRWCAPDGTRPAADDPPPGPPFRPWFELRPPGAETVVFGHWASRGLVRAPGLRGLDTGCVWGGALTAWIAEEDRLVQVEAARAYQTP